MVRKDQYFKDWEVLEHHALGKSPSYLGNPLSKRDKRTWVRAIITQAMVMEELYGSSVSPPKVSRSWSSWVLFLAASDVGIIGDSLKIWATQLRNYQYTECPTFRSFKRYMGRDDLVLRYFEPVRGILEHFVETGGVDHHSFTVLHQHIVFLSHLTLDCGLEESAEVSYLASQSREVELDEQLMQEVKAVIDEWLAGFEWPSWLPVRHGPGGVAGLGRCSANAKYNAFVQTPQLRYFLSQVYPDRGLTQYPFEPPIGNSGVAEIVFVPKGLTSRRTISMEPAMLQYFQQGVLHAVLNWMDSVNHPLLHAYRRHDAGYNGDLALKGSRDGSLATIDLSAASDDVTWDLVKRLFCDTPLFVGLIGTRSRSFRLPSGRIASQRSFAPMGSALCFLIETMVFAAVCEATVRRTHPRGSVLFAVYGDDIIIETWLASQVADNLVSMGFQVNQSKSFINMNGPNFFRESCGTMAFNGHDVTPLVLGRRYSTVERAKRGYRDASYIEGQVDLLNDLFRRGAIWTRRFIMRSLLKYCSGEPPLFSANPHLGIETAYPTNYLAKKSSRNWRTVVQHYSVKSTPIEEEIDPENALFDWFRLSMLKDRSEVTNPDDTIGVDMRRGTVRWGRSQTFEDLLY